MNTKPIIHYHTPTGTWLRDNTPIRFTEARELWDHTGSAIWSETGYSAMAAAISANQVSDSKVVWFDVNTNTPDEGMSFLVADDEVCHGEAYLDDEIWRYPCGLAVNAEITRYAELPEPQ